MCESIAGLVLPSPQVPTALQGPGRNGNALVQLEGNARESVRFLQRKETCLQETRLKERRLRLSSAELLHRPFLDWKSGFLRFSFRTPHACLHKFLPHFSFSGSKKKWSEMQFWERPFWQCWYM